MKKGMMLAATSLLLVFAAFAVKANEANGAETTCVYEDWGQVSGGHHDCLGVACDPGWCCKICTST